MKRSRLKLFKTTSLTISLIGVILILITIGVIAYIGVSSVTNSVSTSVSSGAEYDQLNQLKSQYNNVSETYMSISNQITQSKDKNLKTTYNNGKLKLSEANTTINSIEKDIHNGKSEDVIKSKVDSVNEDLKFVKETYSNLTS
jgi:predicted PurR-regulated permease PerM